MADENEIEPVADVPKVCEAIVRLLQADPKRYRQFGCWWWAIKRILKQHGYGPDQLYLLGPYTDPEAEAHLPVETDAVLLALAIQEQERNAIYQWDSADVYYPDSGEAYRLEDQDAGGL